MKKKILCFVVALVFGVVVMPKVNAVHVTGDDKINYEGSNVTVEVVEGEENSYKVTLDGDTNQDFEIKSGEKVVLDLAGYTFKNFTESLAAIWVLDGGELTIIDSSEEQTGKIQKVGSGVSSAVDNKGILTIEGGEISTTVSGTAGVYNAGTLVIKGGTIKNTTENTWGLTNEGTAEIYGGNFTQEGNYSVVLNAKEMTVYDGIFSSEGEEHYSLITNKSKEDSGEASLDIKGGEFNVDESTPLFYNEGEDLIEITGGKYSKDITEYVKDGFELQEDEEGNIIVKEKEEEEEEKEIPTTPSVEAPNTIDRIFTFVIIGLVSLIGVISAGYVFKRKLEN